jgi:hypothetical protein
VEVKSQLFPAFPHIVIQSAQLLGVSQLYFESLQRVASPHQNTEHFTLTELQHASLSANLLDIGELLQNILDATTNQRTRPSEFHYI